MKGSAWVPSLHCLEVRLWRQDHPLKMGLKFGPAACPASCVWSFQSRGSRLKFYLILTFKQKLVLSKDLWALVAQAEGNLPDG